MSDQDQASGRDDSTLPETPDAKARLSVPPFEIPANGDLKLFAQSLANVLVKIADNLQFLRDIAEKRGHQEEANERSIRLHDRRLTKVEEDIATIKDKIGLR